MIDNRSKYRSTLGGLASLSAFIAILGYFIFLCSNVWNFKFSVKNSIYVRNLAFDETKIELTPEMFDFSINYYYYGTNSTIAATLDRYLSLRLEIIRANWVDDGKGGNTLSYQNDF